MGQMADKMKLVYECSDCAEPIQSFGCEVINIIQIAQEMGIVDAGFFGCKA